MLLKEKKLSSFSVGSFGGGGGINGAPTREQDDLVSRAIYLFNRISALESKMSELYMRPRMDYTDLAQVGWILRFNPPTARIAPNQPRWGRPRGITSDRKDEVYPSPITSARTDITNFTNIYKQEIQHFVPHNTKIKQEYVYLSETSSGSIITTTTTTTTVDTIPQLSTTYKTTQILDETFETGIPNEYTVTGTLTETYHLHYTEGAWETTSIETHTTYPEGETPGLYITTIPQEFYYPPGITTDPAVTTTQTLVPPIIIGP